jgi:hypothetical protein
MVAKQARRKKLNFLGEKDFKVLLLQGMIGIFINS